MLSYALEAWLVTTLTALAMLYLSIRDGIFLPSQMLVKFGPETKGIPALVDFFIWADIFWLPFIVAYIVYEEANQWSTREIVFSVLVSGILTFLFHRYMILTGRWPATLGSKLQGHTPAGLLHIPFMTWALTPIWLHIFSASSPTTSAIIAGMLVIQIALDLHVPMWFIQRKFQFPWYPSVMEADRKQRWMLGSAITLVLLVTGFKLLM